METNDMASWVDEDGSQVDSPVISVTSQKNWREFRAKLIVSMSDYGWDQTHIGYMFGLGRSAISKIIDRALSPAERAENPSMKKR